jgi:copper chaperone NosL
MRDSLLKRHLLASLFIAFGLLACSEEKPVEEVMQQAVRIESSDECHLCGMLITRFPGPKGQLYEQRQQQVKKFCSTRDLFAHLLQPENSHRVSQVFVHDMAVSPWDNTGEMYIDARQAWYVVKHSQQGAMGPTLASFKTREAARSFGEHFGGRVIRFEEVTLELLTTL